MAFRHAGEEYQPWFVECATTVPFGFFYIRDGKSIFAVQGSLACNPDIGVRRALDALGFDYSYAYFDKNWEGQKALSEGLRYGPVICGPVTTRLLSYDPAKKYVPPNSDHYVLAVAIDENSVTLHDPEGYLYARMKLQDFLESWKAEKVPYKQGSYTMISNVRKRESVAMDKVNNRILKFASDNLNEEPPKIGVDYVGVGPSAMRQLAEDLARLKPVEAWRSLFYFSFPVSGQRCHDVALFLSRISGRHFSHDAAGLKLDQSVIYSELRGQTREKRWGAISKGLLRIAELEDRFKGIIKDQRLGY
jgi:hypothetical protein